MKDLTVTAIGVVGGFIAAMLGGWSSGLATLLIFMAIDYITGLIVAGVFKKSGKTKSGALESNAGFRGICKKGVMLLIIMVGHRLDVTMGTTIVKDGVIIAFIANELISLVENAGKMGIPMPDVITKAIDVLSKKG